MTQIQSAEQIFDQCYLEVRAKLLDVAASLDRIGRADSTDEISSDPRLRKIRDSLLILGETGFDRAERIQMIFSDEYQPHWNQNNSSI